MANINFKYLETVRLNYDNGTNAKLKFLDLIQLDDENYIVLLPDGGKGDIVQIYRLENMESKSTLRYLPVEDKELENRILDIYNKGNHNYLNKKSKSKKLIYIVCSAIPLVVFLLLFHEYTTMKTSAYHVEEAHNRMITPAWSYMTDNITDVTFEYKQYRDGCIETKIFGLFRLKCDPMEVINRQLIH